MWPTTNKSRLARTPTQEEDSLFNSTNTIDPRPGQNEAPKQAESHSASIERIRRRSRVSKLPISNIHLTAIRNRQALKNQQARSKSLSTRSPLLYHDEASSSMVSFASFFSDRWRSKRDRGTEGSKTSTRRVTFLETVLNEVYEICRQPGPSKDPFSRFPAPWNPVFAPILDYYHSYSAPTFFLEFIAGWDGIQLSEILSWPIRATIAMSEPALFFSTLALTAMLLPDDHPLSTHSAPPLLSMLTSKTVEELNASMTDPARKCSHSNIHAILTVVLAETIQGRSEVAQQTLLPAVKYMVIARGGLDNISAEGSDGRSLARLIVWIDRSIASSAKRPSCLEDLCVAERTPQYAPSLQHIFRKRQKRSCAKGNAG